MEEFFFIFRRGFGFLDVAQVEWKSGRRSFPVRAAQLTTAWHGKKRVTNRLSPLLSKKKEKEKKEESIGRATQTKKMNMETQTPNESGRPKLHSSKTKNNNKNKWKLGLGRD